MQELHDAEGRLRLDAGWRAARGQGRMTMQGALSDRGVARNAGLSSGRGHTSFNIYEHHHSGLGHERVRSWPLIDIYKSYKDRSQSVGSFVGANILPVLTIPNTARSKLNNSRQRRRNIPLSVQCKRFPAPQFYSKCKSPSSILLFVLIWLNSREWCGQGLVRGDTLACEHEAENGQARNLGTYLCS
jgi:hypothetical protein